MRFLLKNSIISKEEDLITPRKSKQHDKQFKLDAVQYVNAAVLLRKTGRSAPQYALSGDKTPQPF